MIGYGTPAEMVEHAQKMQEQYGINAFKIKTGRDVQSDIAACKAIRNALPGAYLYLDANHGWTSDEAIWAAHALADLQLAFFEEPSPAQDRIGRRRLNSVMKVPICGDESCITLSDVSREVMDGMAQMISIKTARTGFTESRKIVDFCEAMSIPVVMGNQGDTMLGSLATLHFGTAFKQASMRPAEMTNFLEIKDHLLADPLVIRSGEMIVPKRPGLGIMIDEDKLNHYRIDD